MQRFYVKILRNNLASSLYKSVLIHCHRLMNLLPELKGNASNVPSQDDQIFAFKMSLNVDSFVISYVKS